MAQGGGRQRTGKGIAAKSAAQVEQNGRQDPAGIAQNMIDLDFLRGLIEAVDQSGIDSLEINRAGTRIRIAKTPAAAPMAFSPAMSAPMLGAAPQAHGAPQAPSAAAAPAATATAVASATEAAPAAEPASKSHLVDIKSPMVGTFYRAPAPDAPSYVEVGTPVGKGQTLCILEAMKLMNELECEVDGVIREILIEDADPVEFGQVLFRVEPSK
jgi:acetyl-CoA carboxylase biotin carboxyl carrier protein